MQNNIIVIAEIGVNHNGSVALAKNLITAAKNSGADYVKFQYFKSYKLVSKDCNLTKYQLKNSPNEKNQFNLLRKLELKRKDLLELKRFCKKKKIKFFCSIFSEDDFTFVNKINENFIKIPSGEINNFFLLDKLEKSNKKIIISTGASSYLEITKTVNFLNKKKHRVFKKKLCIMHCVSKYPSNIKDLNLNNIHYLKKKFGTEVGFSDHSKSLNTGLYATLLGAKIIEKHLTLNNLMKGPDHKSSLNPKNFKKYVKNIRMADIILGSKNKNISLEEFENKKLIRKSLVAKKNIKKGEKFTKENVTALRPGLGIEPFKFIRLKGTKAKKNFKKNEFL